MSWTIVFETKIVKLTDGRIIHFDLSGCNNDTAGRRRDDFRAKIYSIDAFVAKAEKFKAQSKPYIQGDGFDLKIGSRYCSMFDYGNHLLRMLKNAETYGEFIKKRPFSVMRLTGISLWNNEKEQYEDMTFDEFDSYLETVKPSSYRYRRNFEYIPIQNEQEIVSLIEKNEPIEISIGKKWK